MDLVEDDGSPSIVVCPSKQSVATTTIIYVENHIIIALYSSTLMIPCYLTVSCCSATVNHSHCQSQPSNLQSAK